ncbi:hypothetical protein EI555_012356 [Monodon monoceros]|uniref:Uncharacterized protein n=1 Tax=Monodon monoceros TaxID=40151 RepID=A0A4U1FEQ9_MONMO|nr:hypothetical protein EI555_012356 [Monodon monoceros]
MAERALSNYAPDLLDLPMQREKPRPPDDPSLKAGITAPLLLGAENAGELGSLESPEVASIMAELKVETRTSVDWQKRCLALESQLFRFRLQASKIRELLADKMQELEQRLLEAEQRAEDAETQVGVMEEKVKLSNLKNMGSAGSLHRKYQELLNAMQGKDELIGRLEAQLEKQKKMRAEEAKIVQEKAAKIKEWVTLKLAELKR